MTFPGIPLTKGTSVWHGVTVLIILATLGVAFWGLHHTVENFEAMVHDVEVSEELLELFIEIKVAEDQHRDFLLTQESTFLEAYNVSVQKASSQMKSLEKLSALEPRLREVYPEIETLIRQRLKILQATLDEYHNRGLATARNALRSGEGMHVMNEIQRRVLDFQAEDLIRSRRLHEKAHELETFTVLVMAGGILLTLLASLGTLWKFSRDLTKRQDLEKRLLEEAKLAEISRRIGDLGHDIKNMLTPVQMGMALLEDELNEHFQSLSEAERRKSRAARELAAEVMSMAKRGTHRVQERVKEIADAVKGNSSPPQFTACQIHEIVGNVMDALRLCAEERNVALHTQGLETLPIVRADEQRLFNAFYNLVNNAIPEVPPGGSVTVKGNFSGDGKTIQLSVADTGRGMSPEVVQALFTPRGISRKIGGTGLGTKIVKDVVTLHGGMVTVESQPGKGTTFHIVLPKDGPADSGP